MKSPRACNFELVKAPVAGSGVDRNLRLGLGLASFQRCGTDSARNDVECHTAGKNVIQKGATPMKRLACVLALSLLLFPACGTEQNTASQNENKDTDSSRQQRQMYQDQVEAKLRELDHEIDALTQKIENESHGDSTKARQEEYRAKAQQQVAELNRKREAARRELDRLKSSSQDAWQDMKVGINAAMQDLKAAYDRAAAQFK
jgi:hypothetical protein